MIGDDLASWRGDDGDVIALRLVWLVCKEIYKEYLVLLIVLIGRTSEP